jgi:hypothetical protein
MPDLTLQERQEVQRRLRDQKELLVKAYRQQDSYTWAEIRQIGQNILEVELSLQFNAAGMGKKHRKVETAVDLNLMEREDIQDELEYRRKKAIESWEQATRKWAFSNMITNPPLGYTQPIPEYDRLMQVNAAAIKKLKPAIPASGH